MKIFKQRRIALGLTCQNVADKLGVSKQAISHYETGRRYPEGKALNVLCRLLQIDPDTMQAEKGAVSNSKFMTFEWKGVEVRAKNKQEAASKIANTMKRIIYDSVLKEWQQI